MICPIMQSQKLFGASSKPAHMRTIHGKEEQESPLLLKISSSESLNSNHKLRSPQIRTQINTGKRATSLKCNADIISDITMTAIKLTIWSGKKCPILKTDSLSILKYNLVRALCAATCVLYVLS